MTPVSEVMDDRDAQIAKLIRGKIAERENNRLRCGFPKDSANDLVLMAEIVGLRHALAFVDPNPMR